MDFFYWYWIGWNEMVVYLNCWISVIWIECYCPVNIFLLLGDNKKKFIENTRNFNEHKGHWIDINVSPRTTFVLCYTKSLLQYDTINLRIMYLTSAMNYDWITQTVNSKFKCNIFEWKFRMKSVGCHECTWLTFFCVWMCHIYNMEPSNRQEIFTEQFLVASQIENFICSMQYIVPEPRPERNRIFCISFRYKSTDFFCVSTK